MGAHRACHRANDGPAERRRTVTELLAEAGIAAPVVTLDVPADLPAPAIAAAANPESPFPGVMPSLPAEAFAPIAVPARSARPVTGRTRRSLPNPRSPRSTFAVVAAASVGASTAAVGMTGAFAAIGPTGLDGLTDTQTFTRTAAMPLDMAANHAGIPGAPAAFTASAPGSPVSQASPAAMTGAPGALAAATTPAAYPASASETAGSVMAADLHQSDAQQIASLSRSVDLAAAQLKDPVKSAVSPLFDASPVATKALSRAMSKMGKPYVWGAVGPNAFDCSGLVMWAYKQMGISLPRTSSAQSKVGTPVSKSQLKPGDLVFYYSPVSHVGMYIGNGKIVHASESGKPVKISDVDDFPFHNARRVTT